MTDWLGKPYYSLDAYLKKTFGEKVYKLSLDGGMTCPNRDGTCGDRGCIFCSAGGSGDFAGDRNKSIPEQIREQKSLLQQKRPVHKFIAYFQAYTNTYAPVEYLETACERTGTAYLRVVRQESRRLEEEETITYVKSIREAVEYLEKIFREAISDEEIVVLSIGTRPDCLGEEVLSLLEELNRIKPVWVELGLQTMHEKTAQYIRRGYPLSCFEQAVNELQRRGIPVIVHTILGLPGEGQEEVFATMDYLNGLSISGIKLQLLHVLKNTDLAADYAAGKFEVLEQDAYLTLVIDCLRRLRPDLVIHRVTGDGPGDLLIAPTWSQAKRTVLNELHHRMKEENAYQGQLLDEEKGGNTP